MNLKLEIDQNQKLEQYLQKELRVKQDIILDRERSNNHQLEDLRESHSIERTQLRREVESVKKSFERTLQELNALSQQNAELQLELRRQREAGEEARLEASRWKESTAKVENEKIWALKQTEKHIENIDQERNKQVQTLEEKLSGFYRELIQRDEQVALLRSDAENAHILRKQAELKLEEAQYRLADLDSQFKDEINGLRRAQKEDREAFMHNIQKLEETLLQKFKELNDSELQAQVLTGKNQVLKEENAQLLVELRHWQDQVRRAELEKQSQVEIERERRELEVEDLKKSQVLERKHNEKEKLELYYALKDKEELTLQLADERNRILGELHDKDNDLKLQELNASRWRGKALEIEQRSEAQLRAEKELRQRKLQMIEQKKSQEQFLLSNRINDLQQMIRTQKRSAGLTRSEKKPQPQRTPHTNARQTSAKSIH